MVTPSPPRWVDAVIQHSTKEPSRGSSFLLPAPALWLPAHGTRPPSESTSSKQGASIFRLCVLLLEAAHWIGLAGVHEPIHELTCVLMLGARLRLYELHSLQIIPCKLPLKGPVPLDVCVPARVWDLTSGKCERTLAPRGGPVLGRIVGLALTPDGCRAICGYQPEPKTDKSSDKAVR